MYQYNETVEEWLSAYLRALAVLGAKRKNMAGVIVENEKGENDEEDVEDDDEGEKAGGSAKGKGKAKAKGKGKGKAKASVVKSEEEMSYQYTKFKEASHRRMPGLVNLITHDYTLDFMLRVWAYYAYYRHCGTFRVAQLVGLVRTWGAVSV